MLICLLVEFCGRENKVLKMIVVFNLVYWRDREVRRRSCFGVKLVWFGSVEFEEKGCFW